LEFVLAKGFSLPWGWGLNGAVGKRDIRERGD